MIKIQTSTIIKFCLIASIVCCIVVSYTNGPEYFENKPIKPDFEFAGKKFIGYNSYLKKEWDNQQVVTKQKCDHQKHGFQHFHIKQLYEDTVTKKEPFGNEPSVINYDSKTIKHKSENMQFQFMLCTEDWKLSKKGLDPLKKSQGTCKNGNHQAFLGYNGVCKYTFDSPVARGLNEVGQGGQKISELFSGHSLTWESNESCKDEVKFTYHINVMCDPDQTNSETGPALWKKNKFVESEDGCSLTVMYQGIEGCHKVDYDQLIGKYFTVMAIVYLPIGLYLLFLGSKNTGVTSLILITMFLIMLIFSIFILSGFLNLIDQGDTTLLLAPIYTSLCLGGSIGYWLAWHRFNWAKNNYSYIVSMSAFASVAAVLFSLTKSTLAKNIGILLAYILGFFPIYCSWKYMMHLVVEHKKAKKQKELDERQKELDEEMKSKLMSFFEGGDEVEEMSELELIKWKMDWVRFKMVGGQILGSSVIGAVLIVQSIGLIFGGLPLFTIGEQKELSIDDYNEFFWLYLALIVILTVIGTWSQRRKYSDDLYADSEEALGARKQALKRKSYHGLN